MHQSLRIPEILINIFGYCSTEPLHGKHNSADLAVLARTCRTFKEPALDMLWEELYDLSPLARCLPEACYLVEPDKTKTQPSYWQEKPLYKFSRPLNEAEWITLRSYTRRVRFIRSSFEKITQETIRTAFKSLAPFDNPLFPYLRSLHLDSAATSALPHIVAPSLKILHLSYIPELPETFNNLGNWCPHVESLELDCFYSVFMNSAISDLVCRWPKLQRVACWNVAFNMNAISHLSSVSGLKLLKLRVRTSLVQDISHLNSKLVFSSLTFLEITSKSLDTITSLLRYIRLPAIRTLSVIAKEGCISRQAIQLFWAAVREACSSSLTYLTLYGSQDEDEEDEEEEEEEIPPCREPLLCLMLDVLHPCTAFANLRGFDVDLGCPVRLNDAELLDLVSPCTEYLLINAERGWQIHGKSGGITLSGLVQLLRKCPSLNRLCLAIDTRTFTKVPKRLDVSFLARRQLEINIVDSYIRPKFVPGLVSVFTRLGLDQVSTNCEFDWDEELWSLWNSVFEALRDRSSVIRK